MRKIPVYAVATVLLVSAFLVGGDGLRAFQGTPTAGTPVVAGPLVIAVVERALTDSVVDLGDPGDSLGDTLAFGNPIYDAGNETRIGFSQGSCVRVVVGEAWECTWTTTLPDGQIVVQGPFYDEADSVLAITGGTGAYAGARGQMFLRARDDEGAEYDFVFEIV